MGRRIAKESLRRAANDQTQLNVFRAYLAEDYDGIGQFVTVILSRSSVTSGGRAYVSLGDHGTKSLVPRGTPLVIRAHRGKLEVIAGIGSAHEIYTLLSTPGVDPA